MTVRIKRRLAGIFSTFLILMQSACVFEENLQDSPAQPMASTDTIQTIISPSSVTQIQEMWNSLLQIETCVYTRADGSAFNALYPQLVNIFDTEKLNEVNAELKNAFTEWIADDCSWVNEVEYFLVSCTDNFLTIGSEYASDDIPKAGVLRLFCTIDLNSNKRILLDDIVLVNNDFKQYVANLKSQTGSSLWETSDYAYLALEQSCMSEKEYLDYKRNVENVTFEKAATWGLLLFKGNSYLMDHELFIVRDGLPYVNVHIPLTSDNVIFISTYESISPC